MKVLKDDISPQLRILETQRLSTNPTSVRKWILENLAFSSFLVYFNLEIDETKARFCKDDVVIEFL